MYVGSVWHVSIEFEAKMFAVIKTGGKQYRVTKDDKLIVEKLAGEVGSILQFGNVLLIGKVGKEPTIGAPVVEKAAVFAEVIEQSKAAKVIIFKKKRRQNYRRTKGHRQEQTILRIVEVSETGTKHKETGAKKEAAPKKPAAKKETAAKKPAAKKETAIKKPAAKKVTQE
jgi:large subunit ribosomal protein L21